MEGMYVRISGYDEYWKGNGKKIKCSWIDLSEKLIEMGSKQAFLQLKKEYPNVCLVHLYTLEGAITNTE